MNTDPETWWAIVVLGCIALIQWGWIFRIGLRCGGLGWMSPLSLFACGMLVFYIAPCLYWQFREWTYFYPGYFDGLPLLLWCCILFGLPFLVLFGVRGGRSTVVVDPGSYRVKPPWSWMCSAFTILGLIWRANLITQGHQGVMVREEVTFLGSAAMAELITNLSYASPMAYFLLVVHGDHATSRHGKILWALDGIITLFGFNRTLVLLFLVQSAIQFHLLGWRLKAGKIAALIVCGIVVVGVMGRTKDISVEVARQNGSSYLTPGLLVETLGLTFAEVMSGKADIAGSEKQGISGMADDVVSRLYEARSASAVMLSVPEQIPYKDGSTFTHILYAFIPHAIWEDKPSLREIHLITVEAMPNDYGVNPLGTIGEFYVNFGVIGVLLGGCVCALLLRVSQARMLATSLFGVSWLYCYPLLARWFLGVNFNFSQNVSEILRGLLIVMVVVVVLHHSRRPRARVLTPVGPTEPRAVGP
jgi:hypothetical protein